MLAIVALIVCLLILVASITLELAVAMHRLDERRPQLPPTELPALLVIRPIRGIDPGLETNVRAALRQEYPGPLEILFVVDDEADPALAVLRGAIAEHPSVDARIVVAGPLRRGRTGKLHAMIRGLSAANCAATLVCFADSDTRPGPTLLRDLAATVVSHPRIGAAFGRAVCAEPARTPWDVAHSVMLDGLYGPQAALTMAWRGSLSFIMGQTMVLRRSALYAAGGLEASEGQLVDDMHIGQRIAAAGYRNLLCTHPVPLAEVGLSWPAFRSLAVRWITYSRTGIPFFPFNVPITLLSGVFFVGWLGALLGLLAGASAVAAGFLACPLSVVVAIEILRRRHGGAPAGTRWLWAAPACVALLPYFFLRAQLAKTVEWRGRNYSLDRRGSLA